MKENLRLLQPYDTGKATNTLCKELGVREIISLASNENQYGCSPRVKELLSSFSAFHIYNDGGDKKLTKRIAKHLEVATANVLIGAGLDEVIQMISRTYVTSVHNIVQADATFGEYAYQAMIEGAAVKKIPLQHGLHDLDKMLEAIDEKTKVVWICNPNNPTGTYITEVALLAFLEAVPRDVFVVIDEAYVEYVIANDFPKTVPLIERYPNLIVLRTFSKAYGLAGLRVGYAVANVTIIQQLLTTKLPYNTSSLSQMAVMVALDDQDFIEICKQENRRGLDQFYSFCEEFDLLYYPSQGNFILIEMPAKVEEVCQFLLSKGIIVRSGEGLGIPHTIRFSIGTYEQNEKCLAYIRELFSK